MQTKIRAAVPSDLDAVLSLLRELDEAHVALEPSLLQPFSEPPRPSDWLLTRFADPNEACFVAEVSGRVVGFVWSKAQSPPAIPAFIQKPLQIVGDVVVEASLRGRGIGRALVERALDWGRARGLSQVQLTVFAQNSEAREFYDKLGFRPLSVVLLRPL
jgi:ribosomal protein S18 acetylase RimI-like enzyme